jgi:uncharacterized protein (DUF1501 family)
MNRREFLSTVGAGIALGLPHLAAAAQVVGRRRSAAPRVAQTDGLVILIELNGGNDGLNTVVPFNDPAYYRLRPTLALRREQVIQLDDRTGLNPALLPLVPSWQRGELAIVQGLGYPQPNLSHFRSIEICNTASHADQYLREGWLACAIRQRAESQSAALGSLLIGSVEPGPLASGTWSANPPLMREASSLATIFPDDGFGVSVETAMRTLAASTSVGGTAAREPRIAAIRLTLNGFDTHHNQPRRHAALLAQLARGCASLRSALIELGRWDDTLVMTCSDFGRRPRENDANGTEHGSSAPHFVMGGRVRGGLHGAPPALAQLDGNGNPAPGVDFRQLYATVLGGWWGLDATALLRQRFEAVRLLRA